VTDPGTASGGDRADTALPMLGGSLDEALARLARDRPEALSLVFGRQTMSRAQFGELIESTCQSLRAEGLARGSFVGWLGLNSAAMLAALFACARLGAVLVPLNWRLAPAELAEIAGHAGLSALRFTPEMAPLARQVLDRIRLSGPQAPARDGDLMLVYTSGTTGHPKGAMHTQAGMLANASAALAVQGLHGGDRVLSVLPMFHVGGLCIQTLPALLTGALVMLHERFEPGAWLRDVAAWRPSTSLLVPAVMKAIIDHPDFAGTDMSSLRFINSGSSVVPVSLIERFHQRGIPVAQVYGSTETGPVSIALHPDEALANAGRVGRAAPGVRMRLVDQAGAEVTTGEVGEIRLQARNLMRGYHREPAQAGFVDGWFATGDLARLLPDGQCEVVGRAKDMIISGGENIYPAEIENLVAGWPGIAEAAVVGVPDERWGEVPVLVLVASPGCTIDLAALAAHFDAHLARFKHPRRVEVLAELPKTALGKVRKADLARSLGRGRPTKG
jgi:fatty-acyl-CoA synthase